MARYDPYDRGDNPLRFDLDVLDMPKRVADKARPKVVTKTKTKTAAAPAKKKAAPTTTGTTKKDTFATRGPEVTKPIAEDRYERFDLTGSPLTGADRYGAESERLGVPFEQVFPPKVPEMVLNPDARNVPPAIAGGLLASPGAMPARSPAEQLQPVGPAAPSPLPFSNSPAGNPALQPTQTTGADQMGAALMNYLRSQLFNQGRPVQ